MATIKKLQFATGADVTEPTDLQLAGGAGSGGINLIPDIDNASNWTASGAGITVATTTDTGDQPLTGVFESAIKITPVSSTAYVYYRFTMPEALKGIKQSISWAQLPESGYAAGDLKLELYYNSASNYGGSYTEVSLSTDVSGTTSIPAGSGIFTTAFDTTTQSYYELRFVRTAGTTAINITNVFLGIPQQMVATAVGRPQSYTPTFSNFGTVTNIEMYWAQMGTKDVIWGTFKAGTVSGALAAMSMPTGHNINMDFYTDGKNTLGNVFAADNSGAIIYTTGAQALAVNSDPAYVYFGQLKTSVASNTTVVAENASAIFTSNGTVVVGPLFIEVSEHVGVVNLGNNVVEYASNSSTSTSTDTTTFSYGPSGAQFVSATAIIAKRVRFQTPCLSTDEVVLECLHNGDWITQFTANVCAAYHEQNTNSYGIAVTPVSGSDTDFDVTYGAYRFPNGATFGAAGSAWSGIAGSATTKWRLKKTSSGNAVGFGLASSTASGLAPASVFGSEAGVLDLQELAATPSDPASSAEAKIYLKGDKFVIQFNDAGTVRYKYLDLTSTGVTWTHTTSAP